MTSLRHQSQTASFLSQQAPLPTNCDEFSRVEYLLQLALRKTSVRARQIIPIATPHSTVDFERRTHGIMLLDSFVDTSNVKSDADLDILCSSGFRFPRDGMIFHTGTISHLLTTDSKKNYRFLLCKIAVGRSLCVEESEIGSVPIEALAGRYDSIYIQPDVSNDESYYHRYLLKDPKQVMTQYLIDFEFDIEEKGPDIDVMCDVCEYQKATLFCQSDNAKLCTDCDTVTHQNNKLLERHIRVPLGERPRPFGTCPLHAMQLVEFYCEECRIPVCVHCKMIGNHSTGEALRHPLIGIKEAYHRAIDSAEDEDIIISQRNASIRQQLGVLSDRAREINENSTEVEQRILRMMQDCFASLQNLTQQKLSVLLGEETELRRQLGELEWLEGYLDYEKSILPPVTFLDAWRRHQMIRRELCHAMPSRGEVEVTADMDIVGRIEVMSLTEFSPKINLPRNADIDLKVGEQERMDLNDIRGYSNNVSNIASNNCNTTVDPPSRVPVNRTNNARAKSYAPQSEYFIDDSSDSNAPIINNKSLKTNIERKPVADVIRKPTYKVSSLNSLRAEAEKKRRTLLDSGIRPSAVAPFQKSSILSYADAVTLYHSLPFTDEPDTRLLYSSYDDGFSLAELHSKIDGNGPTVVIARCIDLVFGGYASTSWNCNGTRFGTPKSFLFSVTHDAKIPYTGKSDQPCCLSADEDSISFGMFDLRFCNNFTDCTSELEHNYGFGLRPDDARTFLAGSPRFTPDIVEVWGFSR